MSSHEETRAGRDDLVASTQTIARPWPPQRLLAWVAVGLIAVLSSVATFQRIEGSLPYPQHVDEHLVAQSGLGVLQNDSLDPGTYRYPSLPIYLTALGMAVGMVQSARVHGVEDLDDFRISWGAYSHDALARVPRRMQAAMSAGAIVLAACLAGLLGGSLATLPVASLLLFAGAAFYLRSWCYLNVDVVTTLFASLTLVQLGRGALSPSFAGLVAWPAVFTGATIASKYTNGVLLASGLLAIALHAPGARRLSWCTSYVALSLIAFIVCCPYVVLEPGTFVQDLLEQTVLYTRGYGRFSELETGWPQTFRYAQDFVADHGLLLSAMVPVGAIVGLKNNPKLAAPILVFPVLLLAYMSGLRVQFVRNMLPAYPVFAALSAIGLWAMLHWVRRLLCRRLPAPRAAAATAVIAVLALVVSFPWARFWETHRPWRDSRNEADAWLATHAPPGSLVVVPKGLGFVLRAARGQLSSREAGPDDDPLSWLAPGQAGYLLAPTFTVPHYRDRGQQQVADLNAWLARHCNKRLARFGRRPMPPKASVGDPQLGICELARP